MTRKIEVHGEEFSEELVELLGGEEGGEEFDEEWLPIAEALDDPEMFPYLIEDVQEVEASDELRNALIGVEVNAQLKMKRKMDYYKRQLFVAESIEKLLYKKVKLKGRARKKKAKANKG